MLKEKRALLTKAQGEYDQLVDNILNRIPGKRPLTDVTRSRVRGGAARQSFLEEWESGLTILGKLAQRFEEDRANWPTWVDQSTNSTIVQDQATEAWWETRFRSTRESPRLMEEAHARNRSRVQDAEGDLLDFWRQFDPEDAEMWDRFVNREPQVLRKLLTQDSLRRLDENVLGVILGCCHAAKAHSRQIKNSEHGLDKDYKTDLETRVELFASYLWKARSSGSRTISEVLLDVIWGDEGGGVEDQNPGERIWKALHTEEWKLPHLGAHIFGELIGYARPDEYPPRNNRVSKTLRALGHSGIRFS